MFEEAFGEEKTRSVLFVHARCQAEAMEVLAARGYAVRHANTEAEALAAVIESPPDVVVVGIEAFDSALFVLVRRLTVVPRCRDVGLIALTGGSPSLVVQAGRAQLVKFSVVLQRPVRSRSLIAAVVQASSAPHRQ